MSLRSADTPTTRKARVALVGAATPRGAQLRAALARFGVPGSRVDLYGASTGEAVLAEYAGEARLIQEPEVAEVVGHDVTYLCDASDLARRVAAGVREGALLIDLVGALDDDDAPLVDLVVNPAAAVGHRGRIAFPHPLALFLAGPLAALERRFGVAEAVAFVIRPAADFGEDGIDELREQTVRLLNFSPVPTQTFGGQLAFNILAAGGSAEGRETADRIARHVERLLGWDAPRLTVALATAPVFHGHCLMLRCRLASPAHGEDVRQALGGAAGCEAPAEAGRAGHTPLDVANENTVRLGLPTPDGLGGFWLWAVAGDIGALAADRAVRLADRLAGL